MQDYILKHIKESISILNNLVIEDIEKIIFCINELKINRGRLFFLGVGGSAANCSHAVNDFRKIIGIEAYTPTDNVSELTARINDEGWDTSFSEWLKVSNLNNKDVIFILSVGGGNKEKGISVNLINAIDYAKSINCKILSILGKSDGYAALNSNFSVIIPRINPDAITPHSEAFQSVIWHLIVSHPLLKINNTKWESIESSEK